jgi:hypothetical protein
MPWSRLKELFKDSLTKVLEEVSGNHVAAGGKHVVSGKPSPELLQDSKTTSTVLAPKSIKTRFEGMQPLALTGKEEQRYLEKKPILAVLPAEHHIFI